MSAAEYAGRYPMQPTDQISGHSSRGRALRELTALQYKKWLRRTPEAIRYLTGRGVSGEMAARYGLGFAPAAFGHLSELIRSYSDQAVRDSGLVLEDQGGRRRYARFRKRIMFPIHAENGELVGFGGRSVGQALPKYLNSPESAGFHKGDHLYGLPQAKAAIQAVDQALIVEGFFDVLAVAQHWNGTAVGVLGGTFNGYQLEQLRRLTSRLVFCFDGDLAGRKAARRALEIVLPHVDQVDARFAQLAEGMDPDLCIRTSGLETMQQVVRDAVPLSQYVLQVASDGCALDYAEGRALCTHRMRAMWLRMPPCATRETALHQCAQLVRLSREALLDLWEGGACKLRWDAEGEGARAVP